jgi:hypothetical protein
MEFERTVIYFISLSRKVWHVKLSNTSYGYFTYYNYVSYTDLGNGDSCKLNLVLVTETDCHDTYYWCTVGWLVEGSC